LLGFEIWWQSIIGIAFKVCHIESVWV
jgi:hypothetical protein